MIVSGLKSHSRPHYCFSQRLKPCSILTLLKWNYTNVKTFDLFISSIYCSFLISSSSSSLNSNFLNLLWNKEFLSETCGQTVNHSVSSDWINSCICIMCFQILGCQTENNIKTHRHKINFYILNSKILRYRDDSKFSDRKVWLNSADPDQTARSGSTLFAISSASFGRVILR